METVRDILAAHRSGISRPGLLAWARLRIDTAMTEAQLEEELARLGDEVVDDEGFLYLRSNLSPGRLAAPSGAAAQPARGQWTADDERGAAPASGAAPAPAGTSGRRWPSPGVATRQDGCGGCVGRVVGLAFVLLWALGLLGGILEGTGDASPAPTDSAPTAVPGATGAPTAPPSPTPSPFPTPSIGEVIDWTEIAAGDCIVVPTEDTFFELRRVPCDTPHGGEVIATIAHPGTAYPDDDAFASFATAACGPEARDWTGIAMEDQELLELWWFTPTSEGWSEGDRTVICYLAHADGSPMERSYRSGF